MRKSSVGNAATREGPARRRHDRVDVGELNGSRRLHSSDVRRLPVGLLYQDDLLEEIGCTPNAFDGIDQCVLVLYVQRPVVPDGAEGVDEVGPESGPARVAEAERHVVPGTVASPLDR